MMRLLAAAVFTVLPVESSAANATRGLKVRREDARVGRCSDQTYSGIQSKTKIDGSHLVTAVLFLCKHVLNVAF